MYLSIALVSPAVVRAYIKNKNNTNSNFELNYITLEKNQTLFSGFIESFLLQIT